MQGLYQNEFNPQSSFELIKQLSASQDMRKVDLEYFGELLKGIVRDMDSLDDLLKPYLQIPFADMDAMERCILRIAVFELSRRLDIPYRVILNEAISLAKKFGAEEGHKYVNAVLDKAAADLRSDELKR